MNTSADTPRGPGRPRKEDNRGQRRRRQGQVQSLGRLGVNPALLDHEKFVYRWVNDDPGRLAIFNQHDDWDFVEDNGAKEDNADAGNRVSIVVGSAPDGSAKRAYLLRKLRTYYDEDRAEAQARLDEELSQLRQGNSRQGEANADYVPASGIRM